MAELAMLAVLALCGCTPPVRVAGPPPSESPSVSETHRGATESAELQVDPELTVITIIVRRAGLLARLGHDHVITSDDESGAVWLGADPASSRFEVRFPVEKLEVDLAAARAAAGAEFAEPVPDSAREGTRQNMLRPEVLDGSRYPVILLRSRGASGAWPNSVVRLGVTLKDRETEITVPTQVEVAPDRVTARGSLDLRQTELGLTPYSVAGGAIQVADVLEIRFVIAASRPPDTQP
jgi:YceI-like domain